MRSSAVLALSATLVGVSVAGAAPPEVAWRITCKVPEWEFAVRISGVHPASRDLELRLDNWGEWTRFDSYYLTLGESRPPVVRDWKDPGLIRFAFPQDWDGSIELTYRVRVAELGSDIQDQARLLPYRAGDWCSGFVQNTLMRVARNGEPLEARRSVELVPPPGWTV